MELPASIGADLIGWLLGLKISEVQEIYSFHKLQYPFMGMKGLAMQWFEILGAKWTQIQIGNPFLKIWSKDTYGNRVFERLTTLKQEEKWDGNLHQRNADFHSVLESEDQQLSKFKQMVQQWVKKQEIKPKLNEEA